MNIKNQEEFNQCEMEVHKKEQELAELKLSLSLFSQEISVLKHHDHELKEQPVTLENPSFVGAKMDSSETQNKLKRQKRVCGIVSLILGLATFLSIRGIFVSEKLGAAFSFLMLATLLTYISGAIIWNLVERMNQTKHDLDVEKEMAQDQAHHTCKQIFKSLVIRRKVK